MTAHQCFKEVTRFLQKLYCRSATMDMLPTDGNLQPYGNSFGKLNKCSETPTQSMPILLQYWFIANTVLIHHFQWKSIHNSNIFINLCGTEHRIIQHITYSISWLLMPWRLVSPGHQQPWYWICRKKRSLSSQGRSWTTCTMISMLKI